jgi:hypothetical protein
MPWEVDGVEPVRIAAGSNVDEIQAKFNEASEDVLYVIFEKAEYDISKTLIIPDNVKVYGMGATLNVVPGAGGVFENLIPDRWFDEGSIVFAGLLTGHLDLTPGRDRTFYIEGLNFYRYNKAGASFPSSLLGVGFFTDAEIINCTFTCEGDTDVLGRLNNPLDVYSNYDGLVVRGCTFSQMADSQEGGVWIRNFDSGDRRYASGNVLIEDCMFEKRAGDEIIAIWSNFGENSPLTNVTVRNSEFYNYDSLYNNPDFLLSIGGYSDGDAYTAGETSGILFENNKIHADNAYEFFMCVGDIVPSADPTVRTKDVIIRGNEFVIDGIVGSLSNPGASERLFFTSYHTTGVVYENNDITINLKNEQRKDNELFYGSTMTVRNNRIYGNACYTAAANVDLFEGNYVEECIIAARVVKRFVDNEIHFKTWSSPDDTAVSEERYVYRSLSNGTVETPRYALLKNNTFYAPVQMVNKNVSIQVYSYNHVELEGNVFYGITLFNSSGMAGVQYTVNNNTFHTRLTSQPAKAGSDVTVNSFSGNKFLRFSNGLDFFNEATMPPVSNFLCELSPVGSIVLFDKPSTAQRGWIKTATGWEAYF